MTKNSKKILASLLLSSVSVFADKTVVVVEDSSNGAVFSSTAPARVSVWGARAREALERAFESTTIAEFRKDKAFIKNDYALSLNDAERKLAVDRKKNNLFSVAAVQDDLKYEQALGTAKYTTRATFISSPLSEADVALALKVKSGFGVPAHLALALQYANYLEIAGINAKFGLDLGWDNLFSSVDYSRPALKAQAQRLNGSVFTTLAKGAFAFESVLASKQATTSLVRNFNLKNALGVTLCPAKDSKLRLALASNLKLGSAWKEKTFVGSLLDYRLGLVGGLDAKLGSFSGFDVAAGLDLHANRNFSQVNAKNALAINPSLKFKHDDFAAEIGYGLVRKNASNNQKLKVKAGFVYDIANTPVAISVNSSCRLAKNGLPFGFQTGLSVSTAS